MTRKLSILMLALLLGAACQEQRDDVANAVTAAKSVAEMTSSLRKAGERAQAAGKLAEQQAQADLAAGKDPKQVKEQIEIAKGLAGMQALAAGSGPVVNWRQLAKFLPDSIGGLQAARELDGRTEKMGALQVSNAKRVYKSGESRTTISISDSAGTPLLRAPFAFAAMMEQDSSTGYKKGKKIGGYTAIVEWKERSKRSEVTLLLAERFVVHVEITQAEKPDSAETLVAQLPLAEIAKLKPEEVAPPAEVVAAEPGKTP